MDRDTRPTRQKINQTLVEAPAGAVLTSVWLRGRGISQKLADYYVRSGWLHRVGDGAFTLQPTAPDWTGAVYGLQQKPTSLHPGGLTALQLAGLAHFVALGESHPLYLFSRAGVRLPAWFRKLPWAGRIRHVGTNFLPPESGLREHREGALVLMISEPERAVLEFLHVSHVDEAGYEHANLVFENLGTLRPRLVQTLLETCRSVRTKRIFLHLAERHAHPWFHQLEFGKVSLGSGKRVLTPGGRLDSKYLITVPKVPPANPDVP